MNITDLQHRITELEAENTYLKCLLDQAGIAYTLPGLSQTITDPKRIDPHRENFDPNQGARIIPVEISHLLVRKFFPISGAGWMYLASGTRIKPQGKLAINLDHAKLYQPIIPFLIYLGNMCGSRILFPLASLRSGYCATKLALILSGILYAPLRCWLQRSHSFAATLLAALVLSRPGERTLLEWFGPICRGRAF